MENIETARQLYQSKRKVIKNKRIVTQREFEFFSPIHANFVSPSS